MAGFLDFILNYGKKTPTIKDVTETLGKMEEYSHVFQIGLELKNKKDLAKKISTARTNISIIKKRLGNIDDLTKYTSAMGKIVSAVKVLKSAPNIRKDPLAQAKAFEQMFVAFGTFCALSPFTKAYAPFFESFDGFFTRVSGGYSIGRRDTFHGKILMDAVDSIDNQFAPKK